MLRCSLVLFILTGLISCNKSSKSKPSETGTEELKTVPPNVSSVLQRNTCLACHKLDRKLIGPSYLDIAQQMNSTADIISLIRNPNPTHWPNYPAMAGIQINDTDGKTIGDWIMGLKSETP